MKSSNPHKELLVAESDVNRAILIRECRVLSDGVSHAARRTLGAGALASAAVALLIGASSRRSNRAIDGRSRSWLATVMNVTRLAGSLYLLFQKGRDLLPHDRSATPRENKF